MRIVIACSLLFFVSVPLSAKEPSKEITAAELYPLLIGNTATFVVKQGENESQMTYVVAKEEKIDDTKLIRVEVKVNDSVVATEHLSSTKEGVFRHRMNGIEINPPIKLIANPPKPGEEWSSENMIGNEKIKTICKFGKAVDITVPAGEFKAYELTVEGITPGNVKVTSNYWFVPKVGIIMQDMWVDDKEMFVIELEKFQAAKKAEAKAKPESN